jgi:pimeloyl-ACP methyl ester carboxylesterase
MADHLLTLSRDRSLIAASSPPADLPVVVISGGDQPAPQLAAQRALSDSSRAGRHVIATRSAHWVQFDEPELVIAVIRELVETRRKS